MKISRNAIVMQDTDLNIASWFKSSRSGNHGACVEIAGLTAATAVRDSKQPHACALVFTSAQWQAFMATAKIGQFDLD